MSKSQIKRLHEQKELEKVLEANLKEEQDGECSAPQRKGPANRFAFFDEDDDGNNDSDGDEQVEAQPSTSQKKKATATKKKSGKNKNKLKEKDASKKEPLGKDMLDKMTDDQVIAYLSELNVKQAESMPEKECPNDLSELLKIDPKMFESKNEFKKILGKAFNDVQGTELDNPRPNKNSHKRFVVNGRFMKPRPTFPPINRDGLSMELDKTDDDGVKWFKYAHDKRYQALENMFLSLERGYQFDQIFALNQKDPYHLSTILSISNYLKMQGDVNKADEVLEMGVFFCDKSAANAFHPFDFKHRLDYIYYENRALFLIFHRLMMSAINKRCYETALNIGKFLFKLDPKNDHLAMVLMLDTIALRAKNYDWINKFYMAAERFKNLNLLPNWLYSHALALYFLAETDEDLAKAKEKLQEAMIKFPSMVVALLDELQIHADTTVLNCVLFSPHSASSEPDGLKIMQKIYVKHTADVWKSPEVLSYLEEVTRHVATIYNKRKDECQKNREKRKATFVGMPANIDRLAQLLDVVPQQSVTNPHPPKNGITPYKQRTAAEIIGQYDGSSLEAFLQSAFPNYVPGDNMVDFVRRNIDGVLEAIQNYVSPSAVRSLLNIIGAGNDEEIDLAGLEESDEEANPENEGNDNADNN